MAAPVADLQSGEGSDITCLPNDVLAHIATLLAKADDSTYDGGSFLGPELKDFTRVCRLWRCIGKAAAEKIHITCTQLKQLSAKQSQQGYIIDDQKLFHHFPNARDFVFYGRTAVLALQNMNSAIFNRSVKRIELQPEASLCAWSFPCLCASAAFERFDIIPQAGCIWENLESLEINGSRVPLFKSFELGSQNWNTLRTLVIEKSELLVSLPGAVQNWSNLTYLELAECEALKSLPEEVGAWTNLRDLRLSGASVLETFPRAVKSWRQLRRLELSGALNLQALPAEVGGWTNLQTLDLNACPKLKGLPQASQMWHKLEKADLGGLVHHFNLAEYVGGWKSLRAFALHYDYSASGNHNLLVTSLPEGVSNWRNLESIGLGRCNFESLPNAVGNWEKLKTFSLQKCAHFASLPGTVGAWKQLNVAMFDQLEKLWTLPEEVTEWKSVQCIMMINCPQLEASQKYKDMWKSKLSVYRHGT